VSDQYSNDVSILHGFQDIISFTVRDAYDVENSFSFSKTVEIGTVRNGSPPRWRRGVAVTSCISTRLLYVGPG